MSMKRTSVGSLSSSSSSSSWKRTRFEFGDSKVYLLYALFDGPVRYVMYKLHTRAIGGNDDDHKGNGSSMIPNLTPVFELPSQKYPLSMGSFALGSRIYLLGGEVGLHGEVDFVPREKDGTQRISEKVYFFDTATAAVSPSSSPLSAATPMEGGKIQPLGIHVNGMIYVISQLPCLNTYFREEEPLFEVFDPQANEGKGEWSSLPRPPFYPRSSYHGTREINGAGLILSHAVVGCQIYFFTTKEDHMYVFDVYYRQWTALDVYRRPGYNRSLSFGEPVVPVSDSAWAALGSSCHFGTSPVSTFDLKAYFGLVGRDVEGLGYHFDLEPPLAFEVRYNLIDMRNGWFCLLKFGNDEEGFCRGKAYVSATVFRLVEKRKDKVSSDESDYWLGHRYLPPPDVLRDASTAVGEVQVFGAEELRSSLFAAGVEKFNATYNAVGCFVV